MFIILKNHLFKCICSYLCST